ncbi:MAG TPA: transporter substrate-binding domain-containing protein, partial [Nitriliruptoraceae bacterium]|nr:transporter substrate-binding domain-containing protein [Nitriliruptoraceae bacterium]
MALATIVALPVLAQEATGEPTPTATSSQASSDAGPEATAEPLMIGIRVIEPFVVADGDGWGGFSIDLWDEVADRAELEFEYVELETVGDQVAAVEAGDVDAATAAISITTERERTIDFSHSFYDAGLQVMVRDGLTGGPGAVLQALASPRVATLLAILVFGTLGLGTTLWLVEGRGNDDFHEGRD